MRINDPEFVPIRGDQPQVLLLLFVLVVVTGTLSEFGFGSKLRDPGKLVCRVTKCPSLASEP